MALYFREVLKIEKYYLVFGIAWLIINNIKVGQVVKY